jgi:glutamine synthetase
MAGNFSFDQLKKAVSNGEIDTVLACIVDMQGRLAGKRFLAQYFVDSAHDETHGCNYLLAADIDMEPVPGYKAASWSKGYGDFVMKPDLATLRRIPWLEKTALVICDVLDHHTHDDLPHSPRAMLKKQVKRLTERGYIGYFASELEFYLFNETYDSARKKHWQGLDTASPYIGDYQIGITTKEEGVMRRLRNEMEAAGIPIENSKGEWGPGQEEINVRYAEALDMADRHVVFKQCLKEVAEASGMSLTFMAKPDAAQAGSSCHIHLSLRKDGKTAFTKDGDTFRWFLGGWIKHVPELMPFYAPTINSYKRYVDASWAPTRLAWSYDNRTAGFRVVGEGQSLRIECRIAGADANPYMALAAALASGLDGIANKIEPPELFVGDVYQARNLPRVPYTLAQANERFAASEFAKRAFGAEVVEHYAHFYKTEVAAFDKAVTDWERKRYFERI